MTFDAGALIALEHGSGRMIALLRQVSARRLAIRIPAGVVAQTWRGSARQATVARLLRAPEVDVVALDSRAARAVGVLCGAAGTSDVVDASVVLTARQHDDAIVTSDPEDLRVLDPTAALECV